jgi:hypothetical protein
MEEWPAEGEGGLPDRGRVMILAWCDAQIKSRFGPVARKKSDRLLASARPV